VFTARYGLSPCITQIRFVFKSLNLELHNSCTHKPAVKVNNLILAVEDKNVMDFQTLASQGTPSICGCVMSSSFLLIITAEW